MNDLLLKDVFKPPILNQIAVKGSQSKGNSSWIEWRSQIDAQWYVVFFLMKNIDKIVKIRWTLLTNIAI